MINVTVNMQELQINLATHKLVARQAEVNIIKGARVLRVPPHEPHARVLRVPLMNLMHGCCEFPS